MNKNSKNLDYIPKHLSDEYYSFSKYVSKDRMITLWYQVHEIMKTKPQKILEVGIGSGIVASILKNYGVEVTTVDINEKLKPDVCAPIQDLDLYFEENQYDVVLCARVLHHLQYSEFKQTLKQLWKITKNISIITLPVDDFRLYVHFRITSRATVIKTIPIPILIKKMIMYLMGQKNSYYNKLWKINSSKQTRLAKIKKIMSEYFIIDKVYMIPEDRSHCLFVLKKIN